MGGEGGIVGVGEGPDVGVKGCVEQLKIVGRGGGGEVGGAKLGWCLKCETWEVSGVAEVGDLGGVRGC